MFHDTVWTVRVMFMRCFEMLCGGVWIVRTIIQFHFGLIVPAMYVRCYMILFWLFTGYMWHDTWFFINFLLCKGKSLFYYPHLFTLCALNPLHKILARFAPPNYCCCFNVLLRFNFFGFYFEVEFSISTFGRWLITWFPISNFFLYFFIIIFKRFCIHRNYVVINIHNIYK